MKKKRIAWNKGLKGQIPWNKGLVGVQVAWNKGKKIKQTSGERNGLWKGDKASYFAIHSWVIRQKGKAKQCIDCGATSEIKMIYWSNVDHKCRRRVDDYAGRCNPCHKKYDKYLPKAVYG